MRAGLRLQVRRHRLRLQLIARGEGGAMSTLRARLARNAGFVALLLVGLLAFGRIALPFAVSPMGLALNYVENSPRISSAGMPARRQFAAIAGAGFGAVVNIASPENRGTKVPPLPLPGGYCADRAEGFTPSIRLKVRFRCAESANPAACAASVQERPAIASSIATFSRSHSR